LTFYVNIKEDKFLKKVLIYEEKGKKELKIA